MNLDRAVVNAEHTLREERFKCVVLVLEFIHHELPHRRIRDVRHLLQVLLTRLEVSLVEIFHPEHPRAELVYFGPSVVLTELDITEFARQFFALIVRFLFQGAASALVRVRDHR